MQFSKQQTAEKVPQNLWFNFLIFDFLFLCLPFKYFFLYIDNPCRKLPDRSKILEKLLENPLSPFCSVENESDTLVFYSFHKKDIVYGGKAKK